MNIEALKTLDGFTGTEHYYNMPLFPRFVYSDGVKFLAENAGAYWLVDKIASLQPAMLKDPSLRRHQFWTLTKGEKDGAVLKCERDLDDVFYTENIDFTDFPFSVFPNEQARIWVAPTDCGGKLVQVGFLPSEN